jgi:hypothetical protein
MNDLSDQKSESEDSCGEDSIDRIVSLRPKVIAKRRLQSLGSNSSVKTCLKDNVLSEV